MKMNGNMATRNPTQTKIPRGECTEFQVHVSQRTPHAGIIDYFEHKLIKLLDQTTDPVRKLSISALIDDYRSGLVALAWWKNEPVTLKVTKERQ